MFVSANGSDSITFKNVPKEAPSQHRLSKKTASRLKHMQKLSLFSGLFARNPRSVIDDTCCTAAGSMLAYECFII